MEFFAKIAAAFDQGGIWMWAICAVQIISLAIIVERWVTLYLKWRPLERELVNRYEAKIRSGDLEGVQAQTKTEEATHPVARAVRAGIQAAINLGGQSEIQAKMDEVLLEENARLEKRTGFLAMLGNVGTLLGLLGTITGMIKSFASVSYANPMEKAEILSKGISEAMNCTAYGLIMAIPALMFYALFQSRATTLGEDLNQAALKVFNWLSYSFEPIPLKNKER